jgi:sterol desaturase/sphingolipid hydroxylase (fatty acid hydroxylase superfamily)
MHLGAVIAFSFVAIGMNVLGHLGFEFYPAWFASHPVFKWLNTSTHHNHHHKISRGNYALYFTFWDKVMGTELMHDKVSTHKEREVFV